MKLSVTSWSFPQCSFKEAVGLSSLLDINAIDISYFYRSALDKELLLKDYKQVVDQINSYDIDSSGSRLAFPPNPYRSVASGALNALLILNA